MRSVATALAVVGALLVSAANSPIASAASADGVINSNKKIVKTASASKTNTVVKAAAVVSKTVVVAPGDYLTKLAEANNSSVQRLYDANTFIDNPDHKRARLMSTTASGLVDSSISRSS